MIKEYNFEFPVHLTGLQCSAAPGILKSKNLWDKIPLSLQTKLADATFWSGVDVVQEELDLIDDASWEQIKEYVAT